MTPESKSAAYAESIHPEPGFVIEADREFLEHERTQIATAYLAGYTAATTQKKDQEWCCNACGLRMEGEGGWISVRDRLPEDYSYVLAVIAPLGHDTYVEAIPYDKKHEQFVLPGRSIFPTVTHWQSLPSPPTK